MRCPTTSAGVSFVFFHWSSVRSGSSSRLCAVGGIPLMWPPWIRNPWSPNPFVITQRNVKEQWDFFGGLTAAIEPYPLKPSKNLLILIPTPIPAAPQHCLHPDTLTPWSGPLSLIPCSTLLLLLLNKCTPAIQECSTLLRNDGCARRRHKAYVLMLSKQSSQWVFNAMHEGSPCLKQLLKPDSRDCGEPHPYLFPIQPSKEKASTVHMSA